MEDATELVKKLQMILDKLEMVDGIERTGKLEYGGPATEGILWRMQ